MKKYQVQHKKVINEINIKIQVKSEVPICNNCCSAISNAAEVFTFCSCDCLNKFIPPSRISKITPK